MRKLMLPVVVPIGLILTHCVSPTASGPDQDTLITEERVEWLGNPTARRWPANGYARNVWDLQAFGGRLYIGCGDMDQNAGPVPLYSYDPAEEMFVRKALFWEE